MPSRKRLFRRQSGWLAIPASLVLLLAGCQGDAAQSGVVESPAATADSIITQSVEKALLSEDADLVVLTFFDLYCLACQQSAENFNVLHQRITEAFPGRNIQMTGIGIGDTAFELDVFQRKFNLTYTSQPDPEKTYEEPFSIRGTPTILVFSKAKGNHTEVFRHEGRLRTSDIDSLFEEIKN